MLCVWVGVWVCMYVAGNSIWGEWGLCFGHAQYCRFYFFFSFFLNTCRHIGRHTLKFARMSQKLEHTPTHTLQAVSLTMAGTGRYSHNRRKELLAALHTLCFHSGWKIGLRWFNPTAPVWPHDSPHNQHHNTPYFSSINPAHLLKHILPISLQPST